MLRIAVGVFVFFFVCKYEMHSNVPPSINHEIKFIFISRRYRNTKTQKKSQNRMRVQMNSRWQGTMPIRMRVIFGLATHAHLCIKWMQTRVSQDTSRQNEKYIYVYIYALKLAVFECVRVCAGNRTGSQTSEWMRITSRNASNLMKTS